MTIHLSADEMAALRQAADLVGQPVAVMARDFILTMLAGAVVDEPGSADEADWRRQMGLR